MPGLQILHGRLSLRYPESRISLMESKNHEVPYVPREAAGREEACVRRGLPERHSDVRKKKRIDGNCTAPHIQPPGSICASNLRGARSWWNRLALPVCRS